MLFRHNHKHRNLPHPNNISQYHNSLPIVRHNLFISKCVSILVLCSYMSTDATLKYNS